MMRQELTKMTRERKATSWSVMSGAMPTVEVRIPISPTDHFYSNVRLAALSLRRLGRPYSEATIQVHVGDGAVLAAVLERNSWAKLFPVRWIIVPPDRRWYLGTANDRFSMPCEADIVICADADTCIVSRIDDLFERLAHPEPSIAGLQAHYPPWPQRGVENDEEWRRIFAHADVPCPELEYSYSMDPTGTMGKAPHYLNFGFVAFNRAGFKAVRPRVEHHSLRVAPVLPRPVFQCQVGLTLALIEAGLRVVHLPHAFNCANDDDVGAEWMRDDSLIRVIHYLRRHEFDRATFLADRTEYEKFLQQQKKNAIGERLRNHIISLGDAFYEPSGDRE